jgi:signal peptidase I
MLAQWWFEIKKKEFLKNKSKFLQAARNAEMSGDIERKVEITNAVNNLQDLSDQISLHYVSGENCLSKGIIWKIYSFWGDLNNLSDSLKSIIRQILETIIFVGGTVFFVKRFWFGLYTVPSESAEPNLLMGDRICGVKYPYLFKNPDRGDLIIIDAFDFKYSKNPLIKLYQQYIGLGLGILPGGPEAWTKRVVGLPGDRVRHVINAEGRGEIFINDKLLPEPNRNPYPVIYLKKKSGLLDKGNALFSIPIIGYILSMFLKKDTIPHNYTFDPSKPYDQQPFYNISEREIIKNPRTGEPLILLPEKANPQVDSQPEFTVPEDQIYLVGDNRHGSWDGRYWGTVPLSLVRGRVSFILWSLDSDESWWFIDLFKNPITFFTKKIRWARMFRILHPFKEIPKN